MPLACLTQVGMSVAKRRRRRELRSDTVYWSTESGMGFFSQAVRDLHRKESQNEYGWTGSMS
ncbi:MAG: hypothetical protein H7832_02755 [Magnetococcus sp. DMHC-6]